MNAVPAIRIDKLSKRYGKAAELALNELTLEVMPGETYGFLGPNGAGKSTTIKLLLNFIQPSAGAAQIQGLDVVEDSVEIRKHVGYLAGEISLYDKMTGQEFLAYMSQLQPLKDKKRITGLANVFNADLSKKIRDLSKGNRQKIGLIQAFMHDPDVLILDEPTSGLDPLMQEEFFKLIHERKSHGASIFFSSHNLSEIQKTCDRVGFIRDGKLIVEQVVADVAAMAARTFDITFSDEPPKSALKTIPGAKVEMNSPRQATIHINSDLAPMFRVLARHKVVAINQRELNLEEEFLHFYSGDKK